ncbi:mannosyltransferase (PIG-V) domain-containing protein [Hirsutella rhossiliensis]|uniref:GPI mannosyltransferase 2 n=1 Tax=Hirsutella rhossiliensis TaxID=111463 RepID=A0A9P8MNP4_9HYPO|nr:mannosyltransferase (PIG-V) domain-containing protein [Hirsutella rhossiliensis]KAH0958607.1 mannosyltransferase (PIG-V) domain-containing protein [Hirsutella rhossiliensis]
MGPLLSASQPLASLTALFVLWKGFLLAVALAAAVAADYDTSTSLFFDRLYGTRARVPALAARLTRWDALYFMHHARDGYVFEQQWAFTAALPLLVRALVSVFPSSTGDAAWEPLVAIAVVHASHLVAVLALYRLTLVVCGDAKLAVVASALHVISPAGLFLSAPYAESPFAALSFVGSLLFALGIKHKRDWAKRAAAIVGAGVAFGLATAFRSNGLSNGLLFAVGALKCLVVFVQKPSLSRLLALVAPVVGGLCVAAGSVVPQALAWKRFCRDAPASLEPRPWCSYRVPSIYTFVQSEYWNVGFLRYWTLNQLPLFLLASPMLAILIVSGLAVLRKPASGLRSLKSGPGEDYRMFARATAAGQALVALLAITNYHVQVITRLSSGYPLWYLWVAGLLMDARRQKWGRAIVVFMAMYAGVQGGLFASFLPPA